MSLKSLRTRLRTVLLCVVLQMGLLAGVQMPPEKIRDLLHAMNQPAVVHILRDADDDGEPLANEEALTP